MFSSSVFSPTPHKQGHQVGWLEADVLWKACKSQNPSWKPTRSSVEHLHLHYNNQIIMVTATDQQGGRDVV